MPSAPAERRRSDPELQNEAKLYFEAGGVDEEGNEKEETGDEEASTSPLHSLRARALLGRDNGLEMKQYGFIGIRLLRDNIPLGSTDKPIFINTDAPWSAFLCGSQGSGKSYTLSCMLENCLLNNVLEDEHCGRMQEPACGVVFHYDSHSADMVCESAYMASHVPVKVLCSTSAYLKLSKAYHSALKKTLKKDYKLEVVPIMFGNEHLNAERLLTIMQSNTDKSSSQPLYMNLILDLIRRMAMRSDHSEGINYQKLKQDLRKKVKKKEISTQQEQMMNQRLDILNTFMRDCLDELNPVPELRSAVEGAGSVFEAEPGTLTIVDLTDPMIDMGSACSFFSMCMNIFLSKAKAKTKVIALDEAHKFVTDTDAAMKFTEQIKTVIREQRHLGARIIVSTQEPSILPSLLELCSFTIVHRFSSPAWFASIRRYLAGASSMSRESDEKAESLFDEITRLRAGQSLVFAPTAMLTTAGTHSAQPLHRQYIKMQTRKRLTADGGRSVRAIQ